MDSSYVLSAILFLSALSNGYCLNMNENLLFQKEKMQEFSNNLRRFRRQNGYNYDKPMIPFDLPTKQEVKPPPVSPGKDPVSSLYSSPSQNNNNQPSIPTNGYPKNTPSSPSANGYPASSSNTNGPYPYPQRPEPIPEQPKTLYQPSSDRQETSTPGQPYLPPKKNGSPPKNSYERPKNSYAPPKELNEEPKNSYVPPETPVTSTAGPPYLPPFELPSSSKDTKPPNTKYFSPDSISNEQPPSKPGNTIDKSYVPPNNQETVTVAVPASTYLPPYN